MRFGQDRPKTKRDRLIQLYHKPAVKRFAWFPTKIVTGAPSDVHGEPSGWVWMEHYVEIPAMLWDQIQGCIYDGEKVERFIKTDPDRYKHPVDVHLAFPIAVPMKSLRIPLPEGEALIGVNKRTFDDAEAEAVLAAMARGRGAPGRHRMQVCAEHAQEHGQYL